MRRTMESRERLLRTVLGPAPSSQYGHMPSICSQHKRANHSSLSRSTGVCFATRRELKDAAQMYTHDARYMGSD